MRHRTDIEILMADALEKEGIEATEQFPIKGRFGYILDFAILELKIDVECDGEHFHKEGNSKDLKRNWHLRNRGWKILRFRGNDIRQDIESCINKIKQTISESNNCKEVKQQNGES